MNHYKTLGLNQNASQNEIEEAHKKLYRANHPDRFTGKKKEEAETLCKQINEAYAVLKDPKKRQMYDMQLSGKFGPSANREHSYRDVNIDFDFFDDFDSGFSWSSSRNTQQKEPTIALDMEKTINISLEEAYKGTKKQVTYDIIINCTSCNALGYTNSSRVCRNCHGQKYVILFFKIPCSYCSGTGRELLICSTCRGKKYMKHSQSKNLVVPAKVYHKQLLIFKHQGNRLNTRVGDLKVTVNIEQDKTITYDNFGNLYKEIKVDLKDVLDRKTLDIQIFNDLFKLKIPETYTSQTKLSLAKKGLIFKGIPQNIYVVLNIVYPLS